MAQLAGAPADVWVATDDVGAAVPRRGRRSAVPGDGVGTCVVLGRRTHVGRRRIASTASHVGRDGDIAREWPPGAAPRANDDIEGGAGNRVPHRRGCSSEQVTR